MGTLERKEFVRGGLRPEKTPIGNYFRRAMAALCNPEKIVTDIYVFNEGGSRISRWYEARLDDRGYFIVEHESRKCSYDPEIGLKSVAYNISEESKSSQELNAAAEAGPASESTPPSDPDTSSKHEPASKSQPVRQEWAELGRCLERKDEARLGLKDILNELWYYERLLKKANGNPRSDKKPKNHYSKLDT